MPRQPKKIKYHEPAIIAQTDRCTRQAAAVIAEVLLKPGATDPTLLDETTYQQTLLDRLPEDTREDKTTSLLTAAATFMIEVMQDIHRQTLTRSKQTKKMNPGNLSKSPGS